MELHEIRVLSFDCYGTLIDWEAGILKVLRPWAEREGIRASHEDLLQAFARAEKECGAKMPDALYPDLLRVVHCRLASAFGIPGAARDAEALANSVGDWPAFPDSSQALQQLQQRYKLVILSNVDRRSLALSLEKLGVRFDALITAEEVGAYKPDQRMFDRLLQTVAKMGFDRSQLLHLAQSLFHDHVPARRRGLKTAWIDRRQGRSGWGATPAPEEDAQPDLTVSSLSELADLISRQDAKTKSKGE
ncbi:MAG: haloacid dehalogenase type II [Acidobacteriota bacterium]